MFDYLINGLGGFAAATSFDVTAPVQTLIALDFNRDGNLDVIAGTDGGSTAFVLRNGGAGSIFARFSSNPIQITTANGVTGLAVGDRVFRRKLKV